MSPIDHTRQACVQEVRGSNRGAHPARTCDSSLSSYISLVRGTYGLQELSPHRSHPAACSEELSIVVQTRQKTCDTSCRWYRSPAGHMNYKNYLHRSHPQKHTKKSYLITAPTPQQACASSLIELPPKWAIPLSYGELLCPTRGYLHTSDRSSIPPVII